MKIAVHETFAPLGRADGDIAIDSGGTFWVRQWRWHEVVRRETASTLADARQILARWKQEFLASDQG